MSNTLKLLVGLFVICLVILVAPYIKEAILAYWDSCAGGSIDNLFELSNF